MRGQSSAEMLILVGAILVVVASLLYLGVGSNEMATILSPRALGPRTRLLS